MPFLSSSLDLTMHTWIINFGLNDLLRLRKCIDVSLTLLTRSSMEFNVLCCILYMVRMGDLKRERDLSLLRMMKIGKD